MKNGIEKVRSEFNKFNDESPIRGGRADEGNEAMNRGEETSLHALFD